MSESHNLFRSVRIISVCTFLSRILGLARDMICASIFGTGMVWDAFTVAFKIPNLFRRLFGEGALSAAFIPIFTEHIEKRGKAEAMVFVNVVATVLIIILGGLVFLGEGSFFTIPKIFQVQEKWQLVFKLSIIMFPYVFFICLVAFMGAVLNTLHHFFMPAFAPVVMNVCWILGAVLSLYAGNTLERMIYIVAVSVFMSGLVQVVIHIPTLRKNNLYYRPVSQFSNPALKLVLTRMGPVVFGLAVVQINVLIDSVIAVGFSTPQGGPGYFHFAGMAIHYPMKAGAASVLYYSDRLIQFPLGVFGIAMATAVFPLFSTHAVREDWNNFSTTFNKAIKFMLFIGIPASVGLIMLREPIVDLLYRRNQFNAESAYRTSYTVLFYAIGIWAYCGLHVLIRAFYSVKDTITPVKIGAICVGLDFVLNLSLIWVLREGGLALSTAISAIVQIIILTIILQKRLRIKMGSEVVVSILKTVTASLAMVIACWFVLKMFPASDGGGSLYFKGLRLFVPMTAAFAAFAVTSIVLKSEEFGHMVRLSLRK
ncbi:MAG TPA: murein biosynthesis integral membrane protein MurJ [Candidatus Wujingus californicus]|uniref:murein biosynthesis integral membrane protein MurJ n=1 Tax=Candidatus Wujingus californicus TaxID=3367618 RepID=UPI004026846D